MDEKSVDRVWAAVAELYSGHPGWMEEGFAAGPGAWARLRTNPDIRERGIHLFLAWQAEGRFATLVGRFFRTADVEPVLTSNEFRAQLARFSTVKVVEPREKERAFYRQFLQMFQEPEALVCVKNAMMVVSGVLEDNGAWLDIVDEDYPDIVFCDSQEEVIRRSNQTK